MKYSRSVENLIKCEPQTKQGDYWYTKSREEQIPHVYICFFFRDMFAM